MVLTVSMQKQRILKNIEKSSTHQQIPMMEMEMEQFMEQSVDLIL